MKTVSFALSALVLLGGNAMAEPANEGAVVGAAPTPFAVYDGAVIDFEVLRKGNPFGRHVLTFDRKEDGTLEVVSDVDLDVKFGPITAFKYRLDATETWRDGRLIKLSGKSNNDGDRGDVSAKAKDDVLVVDGTKFNGTLPGSIIPSSHWNIKQVFSDRMLSTETGEVLDINVENLGPDTVLVGGEEVEATKYRLKSDLTVDLWYDSANRWVKLAFEVRGQDIEYILSKPY